MKTHNDIKHPRRPTALYGHSTTVARSMWSFQLSSILMHRLCRHPESNQILRASCSTVERTVLQASCWLLWWGPGFSTFFQYLSPLSWTNTFMYLLLRVEVHSSNDTKNRTPRFLNSHFVLHLGGYVKPLIHNDPEDIHSVILGYHGNPWHSTLSW